MLKNRKKQTQFFDQNASFTETVATCDLKISLQTFHKLKCNKKSHYILTEFII